MLTPVNPYLMAWAVVGLIVSRVDSNPGEPLHLEKAHRWFIDFPNLPLIFANSDSLPDGACKRQVAGYLRALHNGTLWAVQMLDSSTKYPDGLLHGNTKHLGNFDECVNIATVLSEASPKEELTGRYCMVDVAYQTRDMSPSIVKRPFTFHFDPNDSVWEAIREKGDPRRVSRSKVRVALCVPSSCQAEEVERALKLPLERFGRERNVTIRTSVQPRYCQALKEAPEFSTGGKIFCCVIGTLVVLVVMSTWCDRDSANGKETREVGRRATLRQALMCFSARRSLRSLLTTRHDNSGLDSLHFLRFLYTCLAVYGHRNTLFFHLPIVNKEFAERIYDVSYAWLLLNGPIIIENFFSMGGFVAAYGLLDHFDKSRRLNFARHVSLRFVRHAPLYLMTIWFYVTILPHLGSGPLWKARIGTEAKYCFDNWWSNLLHLNNYLRTKECCMFQAWYLAVDYHMFVLSLLVIYAFWRSPRYLGYTLLALLTLLSCFIPAYITYARGLTPSMVVYLRTGDLRNSHYFANYYVKTHMRSSGYLIGILAGALVHDYRNSGWKLSKFHSHLLAILCVVWCPLTILLAFRYSSANAEASLWEGLLYAGLHRASIALSTVAVVLILTFGDGLDFWYKLLFFPGVQVLAKLTYGVFLVHNIVQLYHVGVVRSATAFSFHYGFWNSLADIALSFFFSFLLELLMEGPFKQLIKLFLSGSARETTTSQERDECAEKKTN